MNDTLTKLIPLVTVLALLGCGPAAPASPSTIRKPAQDDRPPPHPSEFGKVPQYAIDADARPPRPFTENEFQAIFTRVQRLTRDRLREAPGGKSSVQVHLRRSTRHPCSIDAVTTYFRTSNSGTHGEHTELKTATQLDLRTLSLRPELTAYSQGNIRRVYATCDSKPEECLHVTRTTSRATTTEASDTYEILVSADHVADLYTDLSTLVGMCRTVHPEAVLPAGVTDRVLARLRTSRDAQPVELGPAA